MNTFKINFNPNDSPIEIFRKIYQNFLGYEQTTPQKKLWLEQKKVYEEILNAENPELALAEFKKLGLTTAALARRRLND